jgi:hypothetical protein
MVYVQRCKEEFIFRLGMARDTDRQTVQYRDLMWLAAPGGDS